MVKQVLWNRVFELFRVDHGWASQEPGDDYVCAEEHDGILQGKLKAMLTFLHSFCYDKVGKREKVGTLMGKDPFGNSYYELPAQPQVENQSNMRSLRQTKIKTLRSWERGCPLGGMTLLKPTEKRFSLVVHDFKADSEQWSMWWYDDTRWWECMNLQPALTPTCPQNGQQLNMVLLLWSISLQKPTINMSCNSPYPWSGNLGWGTGGQSLQLSKRFCRWIFKRTSVGFLICGFNRCLLFFVF